MQKDKFAAQITYGFCIKISKNKLLKIIQAIYILSSIFFHLYSFIYILSATIAVNQNLKNCPVLW